MWDCDLTYKPWKLQLPATVKLSSYCRLTDNTKNSSAAAELKAKAKGKGKAIEDEDNPSSAGLTACDNRLATLDIFAGCGGLSEGLRQAGQVLFRLSLHSFLTPTCSLSLGFFKARCVVFLLFLFWLSKCCPNVTCRSGNNEVGN